MDTIKAKSNIKWEEILKMYQEREGLKDEELIDAAIAQLETYFECMTIDKLINRSRGEALVYLALKYAQKNIIPY